MAKKINYKSLLAQEQKMFFAEIKRMPKFTTKSTVNQAIKLEDWIKLHKTIINKHLQNLTTNAYNFWLQSIGQHDLIAENKAKGSFQLNEKKSIRRKTTVKKSGVLPTRLKNKLKRK